MQAPDGSGGATGVRPTYRDIARRALFTFLAVGSAALLRGLVLQDFGPVRSARLTVPIAVAIVVVVSLIQRAINVWRQQPGRRARTGTDL